MAGAPNPAQTFLEEAADLMVELEAALLSLEQNPADRDLLDTAFRALHTIKGSGSMFGFEAAAGFTHHLENAFDLVRKGAVAPNSALVSIALAALDHIRVLIEKPDAADAELGQRLLADVDRLVSAAIAPVASAPPSREQGEAEPERQTWRIRFRLPPDALELGTNPLRLLDEMREMGECTVVAVADAVPSLEDINPFASYLAWDVTLKTARPKTDMEDVFMFVGDGLWLDIQHDAPKSAASPPMAAATVATPAREGKIAPLSLHADGDAAKMPGHSSTTSIRVAAERLDDLMDQVGELVIAQARLKQIIATSQDLQIKSIAEEIERLSNGLRDTTMGIRMLPISSLFSRFRRLVRDLSRDLDKDVQLSMSGEETELDKTVIERLNDPLVHIIRNSLDHGLETAEERLRAGKPAQGHIRLSAQHVGTQVKITIHDDGRGLDRDRIRAKAEEQELILPGAKLSDAELFQLIFHPGFSTAATVTSLSGRGVGMDVVRRTIDSLRGNIEVTSSIGQGTEITLNLPLTLAIIDGLLVRVGLGRYVLPLSAVEECVELGAAADRQDSGRNFLNIRGDLVPFVRLRQVFGATTPPDPYQKVVIISSGDRRVGLVVDQVLGDHQTVIKSLSKLHADVGSFSGATILGDGAVALILDIGHLVSSGQSAELQRSLS